MDEMSSPKRNPPRHAKEPTTYCADINAWTKNNTTLEAETYRV
jgi:hypothetical protein